MQDNHYQHNAYVNLTIHHPKGRHPCMLMEAWKTNQKNTKQGVVSVEVEEAKWNGI